jgi:bifunctional DNA-binding transcriptional regulator/antitoxin component of YhaV-PrlF toxin-antitoxin module
MVLAHSKLTEKGLAIVPPEVLKKLGSRPGSVLEWGEDGENIVVRRVSLYTSEDVNRALFPEKPKARTVKEMKEGIARNMRGRYARG